MIRLTLFLLFLSQFSFAKQPVYGDVRVDKVTTIYDGDTFYVTVKKWPEIIGKNVAVRVKDVDTPELKGACYAEILKAREAKKFTVTLIRSAKKVELRNMSRDKYFRIAADVYLDNQNLADALIKQGLGVPYSGGKRISWCPPDSNNETH
jgi:micrococcal nuclease